MDVTIIPTRLEGTITPPPSKSQAHRLLIGAALSQGVSRVRNVAFSQDILATLRCLEQLGAGWEQVGPNELQVWGLWTGSPARQEDGLPHFHCGESGSTLRFLIPIALAVAGGGVFTGEGRLMERPQGPYEQLFREKGIEFTQTEGTLTVRGRLTGGDYALPGGVSSQFFTGLLFALSLLEEDSRLRATTPLESAAYLDMTRQAMERFGVKTLPQPGQFPEFLIPGRQRYAPCDSEVEADWSQAGFYYSALGMGNGLTIQGMDPHSGQGDRVAVAYCEQMTHPGEVVLDVSDCPDLVPPLTAQAALRGAGQVTRIVNAARLRMKESDRLRAVTQVLTDMGAEILELPDGLVITGADRLEGGVQVDSFNDHRIAMMAAMAATCCRQPVTVAGADCVKKSYPNFWEDYENLGGVIRREEQL